MLFHQTPIPGCWLITPERREDERGFFARSWCQKEFLEYRLNPNLVQCNISFNTKAGTLRGMHYQAQPHEEAKLVRCTMGAIYDVVVDLRPASSTFKQWYAVKLTSENRLMLYIPEGVAHGFQTLVNNTEVFYQMSEYYVLESARGVRWNDPTFKIEWPSAEERIISAKDCSYSNFGL
ncbi:dTDP-4-dehydrorhamnose 3,5-epimerase [Kamptonema cortianum]|uniref:dTDP-4-dehydrorhamnose 3,5-epimerase n=1 Tax=Geitlerinema calcuttense NRMC-F 0142 TaxID=2922238 RepID=A0ABT7M1N7_9CYAN|nr:dTDP-4-dehydrorhamnose 3,5-epimerase [Geitlerinema calcuttense]MCD8487431.1 dTDP-4-dehydrorhamnose 3,5-epimerase [Desertifilum sp.]MDI9640290.1 dTDP-4-dehydrorhamnose 3,5-epimerase [Geitlerinema splendidum]MDK3157463.1 dTDP-4-dehydrorhamnose 3,5-epimerase [Kamptonema cortianum]MDL5046858.1 dTDP-4-dehydrorhamnose 3,5-epimerase [Oscillatoria amoena NRMC-F 0135]MDL5056971.1 dTDP-4-dehydrorhamnose 3,5-epimerase [Geitlerinema calcuttense NRMC-F 0142]